MLGYVMKFLIVKTRESTSIRYRSELFVSDWCLIDVNPRVFAILVNTAQFPDMFFFFIFTSLSFSIMNDRTKSFIPGRR